MSTPTCAAPGPDGLVCDAPDTPRPAVSDGALHMAGYLDPSAETLAAIRASFGLPTLPPGTPNRARFVTLEPGGPVLVVLPPETP